MSEKVYKHSMFLMLILFLGLIGIMHIVIPDRTFSESENRVLEKRPQFSIKNLLNGKYTERFEKYISDQFPGRDLWIGIKSDAERAIGKKENNGVILGEDGYLFQKFDPPNKKDMDTKLQSINTLASTLQDSNTYFMLVPNSIKILEEKLPAHIPLEDQKIYIDQIQNSIGEEIKFVDVYDALYAKKDEYIYYKTDHHWTSHGAYYAYRALAQAMEFIPLDLEDFDIKTVSDSFYGTLYSKSGFRRIEADTIEIYTPKAPGEYVVEYVEEGITADSLYNMDNLKKKDKYTIFLDGNHPEVRIMTSAGSNRKLLIIKDSYAHSIIPFLACHFDEIYMIDPRYYSGDIKALALEKQVTDILVLYNAATFFELGQGLIPCTSSITHLPFQFP